MGNGYNSDADAVKARVEKLVDNDLKRERKERLFRAPRWVHNAVFGEERVDKAIQKRKDQGHNETHGPPDDSHLLDSIWSLSIVSFIQLALMFKFADSHWYGVAHSILRILLLERFMLTLHFALHRRVFTGKLSFMQEFTPLFVAPTFGMLSGAYELHHIVMHHRGNNIEGNDISSTMTFDRSKVTHFLRYWARYTFFAPLELVKLGLQKRYNSALLKMLAGVFLQMLVTYRLWSVNPIACFWTLCAPHFVNSLGIMFGNFSQHIFVDPDDPGNSYVLTYNCLDAPMNSLTFNDGYHIAHHLQSGRHWSKLPLHMTKFYDKYVEHKAFAFEGLGFIDVGFYTLTGQFDKLADACVLPNLPKPELIALMKKRLQPIKTGKYKVV